MILALKNKFFELHCNEKRFIVILYMLTENDLQKKFKSPPPPPPPTNTEDESKEKHGVWDPMPELSITSPYVPSKVDSLQHIYCTMGNPYAIVDFIPRSGTLDLASIYNVWE
jgi:hypothetical protein